MLYVPIKKAQPGMIVAKPVCHARHKSYFVQKGFSLDNRIITRLTDLGVQALWIECDGLDDIGEKINDKVVEHRQELTSTMTNTLDGLRNRTDPVVECSKFESKVGTLLDEVINDPSHEPLLASMSGDVDSLVSHLSNCCYMSLMLGTQLSGYVRYQRRRSLPARIAEDVRQLGIGAFVHDLGKTQLSEDAQKIHILHPDCRSAEYRSHPKIGLDLMRDQLSAVSVYLVAHHHQRFDGAGFPKVRSRHHEGDATGLHGERIHVFARILAVADAFDHLLGTPQDPVPTIKALYELQQPRFRGWFDPIVVAALNRLVPPFMVGSIVTLSNGRQAVVVENHTNGPCYPTVRIIEGDPGSKASAVVDEDIDLRVARGLSVAFVDGMDVRPFFFEPPDIDDGEMAYWGLRSKSLKVLAVDPNSLVSTDEPATTG